MLAGNDILLLPEDLGAAFKTIKEYVASGKMNQSVIDNAVKKNLYAKFKYGLNQKVFISETDVRKDLETNEALILKRKLLEASLTMVRNKGNFIPIQKLEETKFASLALGTKKKNAFQNRLSSYTKFDHYQVGKEENPSGNLAMKLAKKRFGSH